MPPALGHNLDAAEGNLGQEEREAVQADNILGPSECVLYAFCTTHNSRTTSPLRSECGKILFTNQRIVYYCLPRSRICRANVYPYTTLVSVSFPLIEAEVRIFSKLASLKFHNVHCCAENIHADCTFVHVMLSRTEDIRDLSAATACMDRVPRFGLHYSLPWDNNRNEASVAGRR
jgi:hypothetical protein